MPGVELGYTKTTDVSSKEMQIKEQSKETYTPLKSFHKGFTMEKFDYN